MTGVVAEGRT